MKHLWRTTKDGLYEVCERCTQLGTVENMQFSRHQQCKATGLNEAAMQASKRYADRYCHPPTAFQTLAAVELGA